jgi:hypothetical protein
MSEVIGGRGVQGRQRGQNFSAGPFGPFGPFVAFFPLKPLPKAYFVQYPLPAYA